jgi:hypothetical protein
MTPMLKLTVGAARRMCGCGTPSQFVREFCDAVRSFSGDVSCLHRRQRRELEFKRRYQPGDLTKLNRAHHPNRPILCHASNASK